MSVILSKKLYVFPVLNGFRAGAVSQFSSKTVKKEVLRTVSNTGICCPSDKVGTVYVI
jgi:hypothetical protein